jgi:hypothetical protein
MTPNQRRFRKFVRERRTPGGKFVGDIAIIRGQALALDPATFVSEEGRRVVRAIARWLRMSAESPAGREPLCLACDRSFSATSMPDDFACVGLQAAAGGGHLCLTGICERCSQKPDEELLDIAFRNFRDTCAPGADLRRLPDTTGRH